MSKKSSYKTFTMALLICAATFVMISSVRGSAMPDMASLSLDKSCDTRDAASLVAENFVRNDATYVFDGMKDTLNIRVEHVNSLAPPGLPGAAMAMMLPLESKAFTFKAKFDSRHSGYGDRKGKILAQVVTPHEAEITVENCQVKSAIMDSKWDMVTGKTME